MDSNQLEQLLRQAKQGDQQALTQLYEQTKGYAYFAAKRYVKNDEDIKDILQDAYIAAFNGLDTLTDSSAFESWLYKIVVYKCLDFIKKKKVVFISEDITEDIPDNEELIPASWLERAEKRRDILHIIDALPDGQRIAIVLFYLEGLSVAEIAEQMELETGTVKSHLYRGRKAIKAAVLKEEEKGNKLYGVVAVPLLTQLMRMEAQAATMPGQLSGEILERALQAFQAGAASGSTSSTSEIGGDSVSSAAADSATKSNSFLGGISMKAKIGAGVLVVALIAGIALFATRSGQPDTVDVIQPEVSEASQVEAPAQEEEEPEPEPEPDYEVTFTSENLETMLRSYLGNEDAPIMRSDLSEITELAIVGGDVLIVNGEGEYEFTYSPITYTISMPSGVSTTYTGNGSVQSCQYINSETGESTDVLRGEWAVFDDFVHLTNLESLAIVYCEVDNAQNINDLLQSPSLKSIDFTASVLPDIDFSNLTDLETLKLSYTNIRNFEAIAGLTNLKRFDAEGCEISDLSFLSGLTGLNRLELGNNQLTDISPLQGLTQLTELGIHQNRITDIAPLTGMREMKELELWQNAIADLSPLSNMNQITILYIDMNDISDISMLGNMQSIEEFGASGNSISDISVLQGATQLTELDLTFNNVSNIEVLAASTKLEKLLIAGNPISDIDVVANMLSLERLDLYATSVADLSPASHVAEIHQ